MIRRRIESSLSQRLAEVPAVALTGPRQVGKTTLALAVAANRPSTYLDLESERDRAKLSDPELYLAPLSDRLVILDEVHRMPDLFRSLRGLIDAGRREGKGVGRFLLLGSASMDLMRQSGESLAGRISYLELDPLDPLEVSHSETSELWGRGGFPESFLSQSDERSLQWRIDFIRSYLERDIPQLGPRIPAETLRRFWSMLAHQQGSLLNLSQIAGSLGVSGKTAASYLDLMVDLLLVRRLPPFVGNPGKRLVRSPKVYVRDSGLVHALLGLSNREAVLGHPIAGNSWEGFVIETLCRVAHPTTEATFYRTAGGAEVDLVLELPLGRKWIVEVKLGLSPRLERGFFTAHEALKPEAAFVVYSGSERFPLAPKVEAVGLREMAEMVSRAGPTSSA